MKEPKTPQEWQDAADAAEVALALRDAHVYGMIAFDPKVDVERCTGTLEVARELGVQPKGDVIARFVDAVKVLTEA